MAILTKSNINPFNLTESDEECQVLIYSDIGARGMTAEAFVRTVVSMGCGKKKKKAKINSYGGEVFDGFAIYNEVHKNASDWTIEINGIAASIASVIAMGADTRKMNSNARIMIHNPLVGIIGGAKELRKEADVLDSLKEDAITAYAERMAGWSREDIAQLMEDETYFTAQEALELGLITEILDPIEIEEPETDKTNKIPFDIGRKVFVNYKSEGRRPVNKGVSAMKCPKCGKEHAEGAVYCSACASPMDATLAMKAAHDQEVQEAVAAAELRITNILAACKKHGIDETYTNELIKSRATYEQCAIKILDKVTVLPPVARQQDQGSLSVSADEGEKFIAHASNSLLVASGVEKDPAKIAESKKDVRIASLHSLMRIALDKKGEKHSHLDAIGLTDKTFQMIGTGSSDLPAALENVANKSLQKGYEEAPTTYQLWTARREVTDFKTNTLVQVSNFGDLKDLPEGSPFDDSKIADSKETYSINTKGRKFTASRNAFVNDDLDVFTKVQTNMGRAVARRINKDVYDKLAYNTLVGPLMGDGIALFNDASHYNLVADSGLVSATSLDASEKRLLEMPLLSPESGAQTQYAGLTGKFLVTGTANKLSILQVLGSGRMDISKAIVGVYNPYDLQNTIPIFDPYLQSLLTAAGYGNTWYHIADQQDAETIGVAYLRGQTNPTLRSETSRVGEALGITYDLYFDWGVYVADYRGIIENDGVTGT